MTRRQKLLLGVVLGVTASAVSAAAYAPTFVKNEIHDRFPFVEVSEVEPQGFSCVVLRGIDIKRDDAVGRIDKATVCLDNTVHLSGGQLSLTMSTSPRDGTGSSKYLITAEGLSLHVVRGGISADVTEVSITEARVCGRVASITHSKGRASVSSVCVDRSTKEVSFDSGEVTTEEQVLGHQVGKVVLSSTTFNPSKKKLFITEASRGDLKVKDVEVSLDSDVLLVSAEEVRFFHPKLFEKPLTLQHVATSVPVVDGAPQPLLVKDVQINGVTIHGDAKTKSATGSASCQAWFEAIPSELREGPLEDLRFKGDFEFAVALEPQVRVDFTNTCKTTEKPAIIKGLSRKFEYTAFAPDGAPFTRQSGPGSRDWVPFAMMSENLTLAITSTEDPGFFRHNGFHRLAVENSVKENLKKGKFFRGASTVSMQLAKNLWLNRSRTLGRKVREAFLTIALESNLTKNEILELYFNVVEFGPNLYGIGPASRELLGSGPSALTLPESIYLVLRLPSPTKATSMEAKKKLIQLIIDRMAASGKVPEEVAAIEKSLMDEEEP